MAGHELELTPIKEEPEIDYGRSFDGADRKSTARYGLYYSQQERIAVGDGDERKGLERITHAILYDNILMEEGVEPYRPLQGVIEEQTQQNRLH